jgi:catechol-2,3-dioxygenase
MYFEHVNLVVDDIPKMLTFYQAAFPHWAIRAEGGDNWNGKPRRWLHFGDHYQYISMSDHGESANRENAGYQIGLAHLAFVMDNLAVLVERMQAAGFSIFGDGAESIYRKNIYFMDPAGFEVEFVEYLSDEPRLRNS